MTQMETQEGGAEYIGKAENVTSPEVYEVYNSNMDFIHNCANRVSEALHKIAYSLPDPLSRWICNIAILANVYPTITVLACGVAPLFAAPVLAFAAFSVVMMILLFFAFVCAEGLLLVMGTVLFIIALIIAAIAAISTATACTCVYIALNQIYSIVYGHDPVPCMTSSPQ